MQHIGMASPSHFFHVIYRRHLADSRVMDVDTLGHGSMQRLLKLHQKQPDTGPSSLPSLAALVCTGAIQATRESGMTVSTAIQHLQAAPELADLAEWTQWAIACEATLGPLGTFLLHHGRSCTA